MQEMRGDRSELMSDNQEKLNQQLFNVIKNENYSEAKLKKVKYLIRLGADVNAKFFGKSILRWLKKDEEVAPEVIEFLKDIGAEEWEISKEEADRLAQGFWDKNGDIKSVEEIKSLVRVGASLSAYNKNTNEQIWKDLSLEEMNEVLKILPKSYEIDGSVNLNVCGLKELPDFSKIKVRETFNCSDNGLTTLKGAPKEVGGYFFCCSNQLTSLSGAPLRVGKCFDCSFNQLTSFEGKPDWVDGDFDCSHNQLTILKGAPKEVGGDFRCSHNQLTTLKEAPREVGGAFDCSSNKLISLIGALEIVGGGFRCSNNKLTSLLGAPKEISESFYCYENAFCENLVLARDILPKEHVNYNYVFSRKKEKNVEKCPVCEGTSKLVNTYINLEDKSLTYNESMIVKYRCCEKCDFNYIFYWG